MSRRNDNQLPKLDAEDRRVFFSEERQNYRYEDGLRWSRIQTVALIEGGLLWAIFWQPISNWFSLALAVGGSVLAFLVCMMALKDSSDARWHLDRIRQLEMQFGLNVVSPKPHDFWRRLLQVVKLIGVGAISEKKAKLYRDDVPGGVDVLEWAVRVVTFGNLILIGYCGFVLVAQGGSRTCFFGV